MHTHNTQSASTLRNRKGFYVGVKSCEVYLLYTIQRGPSWGKQRSTNEGSIWDALEEPHQILKGSCGRTGTKASQVAVSISKPQP